MDNEINSSEGNVKCVDEGPGRFFEVYMLIIGLATHGILINLDNGLLPIPCQAIT